MTLIGQAHALLHENGVVRVQSDIRVGTRWVQIFFVFFFFGFGYFGYNVLEADSKILMTDVNLP